MKNKKTISYASVTVAALAVAVLFAQDPPTDRVAVAFSDPSRPGMVNVSLISGSITVKGYSGKEVIVEARSRGDKSAPVEAGGMKRIVVGTTGLSVEEENNTMTVRAASHARTVDITIQVPAKTSLKLRSLNSGEIKVEGVEGEIEANHLNGPVTLAGIAGSAVAHSLNGNVLASFTRVEPKKAMSFSSMNGTIDVTFPADLRANVKMRSDRSDIFTDFDIQMQPDAAKPVVEDARGKGGRYRVKVDSGMSGTINGGGAEIQFKNHNGPIYIRKAK